MPRLFSRIIISLLKLDKQIDNKPKQNNVENGSVYKYLESDVVKLFYKSIVLREEEVEKNQ